MQAESWRARALELSAEKIPLAAAPTAEMDELAQLAQNWESRAEHCSEECRQQKTDFDRRVELLEVALEIAKPKVATELEAPITTGAFMRPPSAVAGSSSRSLPGAVNREELTLKSPAAMTLPFSHLPGGSLSPISTPMLRLSGVPGMNWTGLP